MCGSIGLGSVLQGLSHEAIKEGEGGVHLEVFATGVGGKDLLHGLKVLAQLTQLYAALSREGRKGRGGADEIRGEAPMRGRGRGNEREGKGG